MQQNLQRSLVFALCVLASACSNGGSQDDGDPCDPSLQKCGAGGGGATAGRGGGGTGGRGGRGGTSGGGGLGGAGTGGGGAGPGHCFSNRDCDGNSFCQFEGNSCGPVAFLLAPAASQAMAREPGVSDIALPAPLPGGTCTPRPVQCEEIYSPVCGCDRQTYPNDCVRRSAGVPKAYDGACDRPIIIVGENETCGLINATTTLQCDSGLFCESETKLCGMPGSRGVCHRTPQQCVAVNAPVCGCDGNTYQNDCVRRQAGQSLAYSGSCAPTTAGLGQACGPAIAITCDKGLVCDPAPNQCSNAKFIGTCSAQPAGACTKEFAPVCGCDGRTYGNDCMRLASGISKDRDGACMTPPRLVQAGNWGGEHVQLSGQTPINGGVLQFDCGRAVILSPLEVDANGHFTWKAQYIVEGKAFDGKAIAPVPNNTRDAQIIGTLSSDGRSMKFVFQILGAASSPSFQLTFGADAKFSACL